MQKNERSTNDLKDIQLISSWLDSKFTGPFGIRFGYDAIIGLIPGFGDLFTTFISSYIILRAAALRVPKVVLAKMGINILIDQVIGFVPVIGDLFDIGWKANNRNYKLVSEYMNNKKVEKVKAWINVMIATLIVLSLIIFPIYLIVLILQFLF